MQQNPPPFLKTWPNVYALVIGVLVAIMILLYFFMRHFE